VRRDRSAHAFSVQFATLKKFEHLVGSQREVLAHCEDYLAIGGLHRETHSHSVLPQELDSSHNVVCSLCETAHNKLRADIIAESDEPV
jgi:hypothetical protein